MRERCAETEKNNKTATMSEEIRTLLAKYADAVNRRDPEQWGATWAQDAVWDMGAVKLEGRDKMVATWVGILGTFDGVVHSYTDGWADLDTANGTGTGRWYVHELIKATDKEPRVMLGYYDDAYVHIDGGWKFASRKLTSIYSGPPDLTGDYSGFDKPAH